MRKREEDTFELVLDDTGIANNSLNSEPDEVKECDHTELRNHLYAPSNNATMTQVPAVIYTTSGGRTVMHSLGQTAHAIVTTPEQTNADHDRQRRVVNQKDINILFIASAVTCILFLPIGLVVLGLTFWAHELLRVEKFRKAYAAVRYARMATVAATLCAVSLFIIGMVFLQQQMITMDPEAHRDHHRLFN